MLSKMIFYAEVMETEICIVTEQLCLVLVECKVITAIYVEDKMPCVTSDSVSRQD